MNLSGDSGHPRTEVMRAVHAQRIVGWLDGNLPERGDQRPAEALRGVDGRYVIFVIGASPRALAAWLKPAGYQIMQEFDQPETGDHVIIVKCGDFDCYIDMIQPDGMSESEPEFTGRHLVAWLEKQGYKIEEAELHDDGFAYEGKRIAF